MSFARAVADELEGNFTIDAADTPRLTLHRGIRKVLAIDPDSGLIVCWNWHELDAAVTGLERAMSAEITRDSGWAGSPHLWCAERGRTEAEVLALLCSNKVAAVPMPEQPSFRPVHKGVKQGLGKWRGVLVSMLSLAAVDAGSYGKVIESLAGNGPMADLRNDRCLDLLDTMCSNHDRTSSIRPSDDVAPALAAAWARYSRDTSVGMVLAALQPAGTPWRHLSDNQLKTQCALLQPRSTDLQPVVTAYPA